MAQSEPRSANSADSAAQPVLAWLATPCTDDVEHEIDKLRTHVLAIIGNDIPLALRQRLTTMLHPRAEEIAERAVANLKKTRLPLSTRVRSLLKRLQDGLDTLARIYFAETQGHERLVKGVQRPTEASLWLAMDCVRMNLMLSNLAGAPHLLGVWQLAHDIHGSAQRLALAGTPPAGRSASIADLYHRILLNGCPHPASFTSSEWCFVDAYLKHTGAALIPTDTPSPSSDNVFWIDPRADSAPVSLARRAPTAATPSIFFAPATVGERVGEDLQMLEAGRSLNDLGLPTDLPTQAAIAVLKRLKEILSDPKKRRFSRRRQGYRAHICFRLDEVWELLRGKRGDDELGEWQVVNESPDGYAAMHVTGRTQKLQVGDVAAIRRYHDEDWQLCLIRWAFSENPEHFELGLQALAPKATAAELVIVGPLEANRQAALLMPPVAGQRNQSTLAVPAGLGLDPAQKQILLVEEGKFGVLEVRLQRLLESTAGVDIYLIARDAAA